MTLIPLSKLWLHPRDSEQPIAIRAGVPISWAQFHSDVATTAYRLRECSSAALVCEDSYYFIVGFFALLSMRVRIFFPANTHAGAVETFHTSGTVVDDAFVVQPAQGKTELSILDSSLPLLQFHTSGTTGTAKIIEKNLAQLEEEIERIHTALFDTMGSGPVLATVPHQHLYCLVFKLLWPLCSGRVFCAYTHTHSFWEMILPDLTAGCTIVSSPAHLSRLGGISPLEQRQRPVHILSAGAPLPFASSEQSRRVFGSPPIEIFGSTETGAIASRIQQNAEEHWRLLPGVHLERNREEQMVIHTKTMPSLTTADRIEICPNGFHFLGRTDRIAKIEAKRVSLPDVEAALLQLDEVAASACLVIPGDIPKLACAVVLTPTAQTQLAQLGRFRFSRCLRSALAPALESTSIPRLWRFVDALPTQGIGKVDMPAVLALFGGPP